MASSDWWRSAATSRYEADPTPKQQSYTLTAPTPDPDPDRQAVLAALDGVRDPKSGQGLAMAGLVRGLALGSGRAGFMLEVAASDVELYATARDQAETALLAVPGVERAQVVLTSDGEPRAPSAPAVRARPAVAPAREPAVRPPPARPAHVRHVVAVASAKGGVGKSTVAVNLACALAQTGLRTGLLDADIYGPSIPRMLGLTGQPKADSNKRMIPLQAFGVHAVSIGLLVEAGSALIWRGPMASTAFQQLLNDVAWGSAEQPMDVLVIDMPPGTGDIQLTLVQRVALDGAVIVSTPQEVALADVRRGAAMFAKTETPLLGVVENMAYFPHPTTGEPIPIFGRGGARAVAEELGAPFLGEVPIDIALRESGDAGAPLAATEPDGPTGRVFADIAAQIAAVLAASDSAAAAARPVAQP